MTDRGSDRGRALSNLTATLAAVYGGALRNTVHVPGVTCTVCARPVDDYPLCYQCNQHRASYGDELADAVATLVYAVGGQQSGYVMRGYKAHPPVEEHRAIVAMLVLPAVVLHSRCVGVLAGTPVSHWAAVPSLPARPGVHALHRLVAGFAPGREVRLQAAVTTHQPRAVDRFHFTAPSLPAGAHVLLVDDTWTSGGHAQSAALGLRAAGADRISTLVVARWLDPSDRDTAAFVRDRLTRDYVAGLCPWTGGACPP